MKNFSNDKKVYSSKKVPTKTARAVLLVVAAIVAFGSITMMIFSSNPIVTMIGGGGQQPMVTAAYAQPMDNTSTVTNTTTTANNILNSTRDIPNTTFPGQTIVYRGIISSEEPAYIALPPGEELHSVRILPHRPDGAAYTGVLTFTATEPVEVGFGHGLPIDNSTLSQLDRERIEDVEDLDPFPTAQSPEHTETPGLISMPSIIIPDYGASQAPYFSASIPFVADSVFLRTPNGEPFVVVYEVVAEIAQPQAVVDVVEEPAAGEEREEQR